ncbi:hypothetical protein L3i23_04270 [Herbiconiux sp. L3-i23]|nr:hypothetical protein L3i23_04270 [Herbiconiux sp. L3-i23]
MIHSGALSVSVRTCSPRESGVLADEPAVGYGQGTVQLMKESAMGDTPDPSPNRGARGWGARSYTVGTISRHPRATFLDTREDDRSDPKPRPP